MARVFGVVTSAAGLTAGIAVNSMTITSASESAEARDATGKVTDIKAYSVNTTLSATGVMDSEAGTLVTAGSSITIDSVAYLIDNVSKSETNTGYVTVTISAKTADGTVITPIVTTP